MAAQPETEHAQHVSVQGEPWSVLPTTTATDGPNPKCNSHASKTDVPVFLAQLADLDVPLLGLDILYRTF